MAWVFDQFPRIRWYMDIHSAVGDILFNWGDDNDQFNDPSMQFLNPAWDGKRGIVGDARISGMDRGAGLRESVERGEPRRTSHANRRRTIVRALQAVGLYPTSGSKRRLCVQSLSSQREAQ